MAPRPRDREALGLADRLVSAAFGGVVGAVAAFVLVLLLRGASAYVAHDDFAPSFAHWTAGGALLFAGLGFVLGPRAASLLGSAISAVWTAEAWAYWWYWPLRRILVVIAIGLAVAAVKWLLY